MVALLLVTSLLYRTAFFLSPYSIKGKLIKNIVHQQIKYLVIVSRHPCQKNKCSPVMAEMGNNESWLGFSSMELLRQVPLVRCRPESVPFPQD